MVRLGMADEAFKYYHGVFYDSSQVQIRRFPKELWGKHTEAFRVPGGQDVFACRHMDLTGIRGSFAAFQVAVSCDTDFTLATSPIAHFPMEKGNTLLRLANTCSLPMQMHIIGCVTDDDRSQKSDILMDKDYAVYRKHGVAMVWVQIDLPATTPPGRYEGSLHVYESDFFGDETICGQLTYTLTVSPYTLPPLSDSRFILNLWQHTTSIARTYEVDRFGDDHFALLERFIAPLARLGQRCVSVIASDAPWAGQMSHRCSEDDSDMVEYNMIRIRRDREGRFHYDYSVMQRYIDLCFRHGIDGYIEVFGLAGIWQDEEYGFGKFASDHPDALKLKYLDEADGCCKWMREGAQIDAYVTALQDYFIQCGLIDRVRLFVDEPMDTELFQRIAERLYKAAPEFRLSVAINHTAHIKTLKDNCDMFSIILPSVGEEWETLCELRRDSDKMFTWYVCCGPKFPNMFISSHLLESRLIGFLTDRLGLRGFLRWDYCLYNRSPMTDSRWQTFHAGDAFFVYPGRDGRPLLSLRYIQLLRGVEDYLMAEQLRREQPDRAEKVLKTVADDLFLKEDPRNLLVIDERLPAENYYRLEYQAFEKARAAIVEALLGESAAVGGEQL